LFYFQLSLPHVVNSVVPLVEQREHAHLSIGFDERQTTILGFRRQQALLACDFLLAGFQHELVSLRVEMAIDIKVFAGRGRSAQLAQRGLFGRQRGSILSKDLFGAKRLGERGATLVASRSTHLAQRFKAKCVLSHLDQSSGISITG
jgi:hypothetical protein